MSEIEKVKEILYRGVGRSGLEDESDVIHSALEYYLRKLEIDGLIDKVCN